MNIELTRLTMRPNNCKICGKPTQIARYKAKHDRIKYRGGWAHLVCKQRLDLNREIIKMKKKQNPRCQISKKSITEYWNQRHKSEIELQNKLHAN